MISYFTYWVNSPEKIQPGIRLVGFVFGLAFGLGRRRLTEAIEVPLSMVLSYIYYEFMRGKGLQKLGILEYGWIRLQRIVQYS
jgi:hypothetical protein